MRHGFSLVELSIVLVILGLLIGGILSGQSLIRAAELRSVSAELQTYQAAVSSFKDKYFALPGDMRNATQFWGRMNNSADCVTNVGAALNATTGTCDGNGDGIFINVNNSSTDGISYENYQFWRQLAVAGLIEGTYSGVAGGISGGHTTFGASGVSGNIPRSRLANAGWSINHVGSVLGNTQQYAILYGNVIYYGAPTGGNLASGVVMSPEELWGIDSKIDDGKPAYGKIIARHWGNSVIDNKCTINATSQADLDSDYNLSYTSSACAMHVKGIF